MIVAGLLCQVAPAMAFPFIDSGNQSGTAASTALAGPDARDLSHQLQLANGLAAPGTAGGWTIQPRLSVQEVLTDNIEQVHSPMRWDLSTSLSPGIAITGQTRRADVRLDYAPVVIINARTGSQNAITEQLNGTATIRAIEDFAFIDLRAISGIQSLRGAAGLGGTIGASNIGGISAGTMNGVGGTALTGNNGQSALQTSSFGVSPYLVKQFGDYGTARIGYSYNMSQSSPVSGFQFLALPTGSTSERLVSNEQSAEFKTGDFLGRFQDTISVDFIQSRSSGQLSNTGSTLSNATLTSERQIFSNALSYALNRHLTVTGSLGHERITYSGGFQPTIDDLTWSIGATYTPNDRSAITISYGHQQGAESFAFNGYLAITPRTTISASYSESVGTQLENLQGQLNQGVIGANGAFVNGQTGGQLFGSTNTAPAQFGVFHFKNLTATATTQLNRDTLSLTLNMSQQTAAGVVSSGQASNQSNALTAQWTHELRPDIQMTTSASYSSIKGGFGGDSQGFAFNTGFTYALTETVTAYVRYSFFKSMSKNTLLDLYENVFVLGVTKQF